jgi:hypothetical protein
MAMFANICSVFTHILPGMVRDEADVYFLFACSGLFFIAYCFIGWSSYYFVVNQKLPHFVPIMISIFFGTFGYLFPPIAICFASE